MTKSNTFYFRSISRRWKAEVSRAADRILIFSPYLTSRTAEAVIEAAKRPQDVEIHTDFRAESFLSGSSSVHTLIKLLGMGCQLFDVKNIHAKVLYIPGRIATIGSQNLTRGGERNKEASAVFDNPIAANHIGQQLEVWINSRRSITVEMLEDMDYQIAPFLKQFKALQQKAIEIDQQVSQLEDARVQKERERQEQIERERQEQIERERQAQREIERRQQQERDRMAHDRQVQFQRLYDTIGTLPVAAEMIRVECKELKGKISLVPTNSRVNLTNWQYAGRTVTLKRKSRYVCIHQDTGKFGWARICQTRVSFIGSGVSRQEAFTACGLSCKMSLSAIWRTSEFAAKNLDVQLKNQAGGWLAKIGLWFTLDEIEIVDVELNDKELSADEAAELESWINNDDGGCEFRSEVLRFALGPFVYDEKLFGVRPDKFLEDVVNPFEMKLAKVASYYVVVLSDVYW